MLVDQYLKIQIFEVFLDTITIHMLWPIFLMIREETKPPPSPSQPSPVKKSTTTNNKFIRAHNGVQNKDNSLPSSMNYFFILSGVKYHLTYISSIAYMITQTPQ